MEDVVLREGSCLPFRGETIFQMFLQGNDYKAVSPPFFLAIKAVLSLIIKKRVRIVL